MNAADMQRATQDRDLRAGRADAPLPHGVVVRALERHPDDRGAVAELFRRDWASGIDPLQWTLFENAAGVLRGVHMHPRHDDYFVLLRGAVHVGLRDERRGSPSAGRSAMLHLDDGTPVAVIIPHGVLHGLFFVAPSIAVIGASHYYDRADELGCHWRDPSLGLAWPADTAVLSPGDAGLPALRDLRPHIPPWAGE